MTWKSKFIVFLLFFFTCGISIAAFEDVTTFTKGGSQSADFNITDQQRSVHSSLADNDQAHVYKDYGVDSFCDGLDVRFKQDVNVQGSGSYIHYLSLANVIGEEDNWATDGYGLSVGFKRSGTDGVFLVDISDGSIDIHAAAAYDDHYIIVERAGTTFSAKIYTDDTLAVLQDTLTTTGTDTDFRYLYLGATRDTAGGNSSDGAGETEYITITDDGCAAASARRIIMTY